MTSMGKCKAAEVRFLLLMGSSLLVLSTTSLVTDAFSVGHHHQQYRLVCGHQHPQQQFSASITVTRSTALWAKKAAKRKGKTGGTTTKNKTTGGGFGATTTVSQQQQNTADDYAVFPALEPDVKDTLIRAAETDHPDSENHRAGELPNEIYQRLDQIYGFRHFNYEAKEEQVEKDSPSLSLQEMLSGSGLEEENDDHDSEASSQKDELPISKLPPFEHFQVLHVDPLVLQVDHFFTPEESDAYIEMTTSGTKDQHKTGSLTVGKDKQSKAQRTSTTWFNHYKNVPELMAKASRLLGLDTIDQWEEPQTVRYRRNEKFTWHLDALGPNELGNSKGGQRTATLLVYHTDLDENDGGATVFRDLKDSNGERLKMRPKKGSALLFFPAAGGIPNTPLDIRTLHCGETVSSESGTDKWISQLWLRKTPHAYVPTAPEGNSHAAAVDAIAEFCEKH